MNEKQASNKNKKNEITPPSPFKGMVPSTSEIPGDSIDMHRAVETANILLTGDEIKQQNENL
ncbi:hypothetical protein [Bacillus sp. B15-48]|uniref:hypothetical protein n=1 Tax=Bacillus sp. B15-48 TaxID=1548601 RepID=UPI00193F06F0|nr:hypothetical protein [Bacillus sp. B15-48]MBM4761945.1 hypothetical protein [Bacillus sp. B15-48]